MGNELAEKAANIVLDRVHKKGHVYVEIRRLGKSRHPIFFCMLCQTQCFDDGVLDAHLNGNHHAKRLAFAKITLFHPIPWPFNDGVFFYGNPSENYITTEDSLVIPGVVQNDEIGNLSVRVVGYGHIGCRVHETDDGSQNISKIWCTWLGDGNSDDSKKLMTSPECDFAIVTFSYTHYLGRHSTSYELEVYIGNHNKRRKHSYSDPEDSSNDRKEKLTDMNRALAEKLAHKHVRRKLKKNQLKSERLCDICCRPMLNGKDASVLMNCITGKLACSSRNSSGAFHLSHTSCLLNWVLLCEYEKWNGKAINTKPAARGRKPKSPKKKPLHVFCPQCQGTGIHVKGNVQEKAVILLSEMFLHKLKATQAQKEWMKEPETLDKCSIGLKFLSNSSPEINEINVQEKVLPMGLLRFYRAEE